VTGHPAALAENVDSCGIPHQWPPSLVPEPEDQERLRAVCSEVNRGFADEYNGVLAEIEPSAAPVANPFGPVGDLTLVNYPAGIHPRWQDEDTVHFLGSCVRREELPTALEDRVLPPGDAPRVYVSLGTFLSARSDVLGRITLDLETDGMGVHLSTGSAAATELPPPPENWICEPHLPQVALLEHADVVVSHGGNNTVTESWKAGLPILALPFSTDQFAGAHDLEKARLGLTLSPNGLRPGDVSESLRALLDSKARENTARLGSELRKLPGEEIAVRLLKTLAEARL
jgi:UDP:flavonoid glycosyltransferase YjiC (YdhE family)